MSQGASGCGGVGGWVVGWVHVSVYGRDQCSDCDVGGHTRIQTHREPAANEGKDEGDGDKDKDKEKKRKGSLSDASESKRSKIDEKDREGAEDAEPEDGATAVCVCVCVCVRARVPPCLSVDRDV